MTEREHETGLDPVEIQQSPSPWGVLYMKYGGDFYGEDEYISIHMTYATFVHHVEDYLHRKGIIAPTNAQFINTGWYLSRVSCWHTCTDPNVEITQKDMGNIQVSRHLQ